MKKPKHITDLGISPALFEAMASAYMFGDKNQIKINKKLIRKELKAQKKGKNLIKGCR